MRNCKYGLLLVHTSWGHLVVVLDIVKKKQNQKDGKKRHCLADATTREKA